MRCVLLTLFVFSCCFVFASEKKQLADFSCSMPILINPIIEHVRNSNRIKNNDLTAPQQCPEQKFSFEFSSFLPDEANKSQYDKFVQISYPELKYKFKLYIKNGIVMKIEQIDSSSIITIYHQTIINKIDTLKFEDSSYLNLSKEILTKIYTSEPIILKLNESDNSAAITLTVDRDVDVGVVRLTNSNFEYRFCYYKGRLENSAILVNDPQNKKIIFSMTFEKNNLILANVYDRDIMNGFDCGFYSNMGLKFYIPMKDGLFDNVTIWNLNGLKNRMYPFNVWQKKGNPISYTE